MQAFTLAELLDQQARSSELYLEFLRVPSLSVGLYALPAGADDPQQPHTEDEVYYVVSGKGMLLVGDEDVQAVPGSVLYVPAAIPHRFHSVVEDLRLLVFFAPAEGTAESLVLRAGNAG